MPRLTDVGISHYSSAVSSEYERGATSRRRVDGRSRPIRPRHVISAALYKNEKRSSACDGAGYHAVAAGSSRRPAPLGTPPLTEAAPRAAIRRYTATRG